MFAVDAHVHFHRLEDVAATLTAAVRNFETAGSVTGISRGALLLTQAAGERVFESLAGRARIDGWSFERDDTEPGTLQAVDADGRRVVVVNGRQIRAACGLEVLALGAGSNAPADGASFAALAEAVVESDALPVVPWGFGKWLGARGERVRRTLEHLGPQRVCIGDNGGRVTALPAPRLLREMQERGFRVLPGSDPFPFARDYRRVGRFGLLLAFEPPPSGIWRCLKSRLLEAPLLRYGRGIGPLRFLANNFGIQVRNRLGVAAR